MSLDELFKREIYQAYLVFDTRKLTRIIRNKGVVKGKIVNLETETESVINDLKSKNFPTNQVEQVSTKTAVSAPGNGFKVVLVDFGF